MLEPPPGLRHPNMALYDFRNTGQRPILDASLASFVVSAVRSTS
jgi:hypothetical protein